LLVQVGNPQDFATFKVDLETFCKQEGTRLADAVSELCRSSAKHRELAEERLVSVRFINAQGADGPNPYIGGRVLIIEFVGGDFDAMRFRRKLAGALERGSVVRPSFKCATASSIAEHLICDEPELAAADHNISDTFKQALAAVEGDVDRIKTLRQSQRQWLAARDTCANTVDRASGKNMESAIDCLVDRMANRLEVLSAMAEPAAPARVGPAPAAAGIFRSKWGKVDFAPRPDGTARFTIVTSSERGICDIPDQGDDNIAVRETESRYIFRSREVGCKIMFDLAHGGITVSAEGACYLTYCGVHAPDFQGSDTRAK
jgi:uncharacterized protein YecT (DUF1311 family)